MKRLAVISGSRADYGVLRPFLRLARESSIFELQLIAGGAHFSEEQYSTWGEIEADGFPIAAAVKACPGYVYSDATRYLADQITGFSQAYAGLKPDLVMVEGDRVEALAATLAAAYMGIPVLHDGGGVLSRTIDNAARHCISHLATLHTVELEEARERLIRYGCDPAAIHVVGALGIDAIRLMDWRSRAETLADLGLPPDSRYLLVTFHPESEHPEMAGEWMNSLLSACIGTGFPVVVTYPNSDPGSEQIISSIQAHRERYLQSNYAIRVFESLGSDRYLHAIKYAEAVVGNSSSGLLEAPTLKVPVVNVGHRQDGRPLAANVIGTHGYDTDDIEHCIDYVLSKPDYRQGLATCISPYGDGFAAERIMAVIERRLGE